MSFDLVKAIGEAIAQDTVCDRSNLGIVHYFKDLLSCFDFEILEQTTEIHDIVFANLIGIKGPTDSPGGLILSAALDTRHPGDVRDWTANAQNPWLAAEEDGMLFGLGASTGKADFLCKLKAAAEFDVDAFKRPLILIATFGRYLDLVGVNMLLDAHRFGPRRALVGASTNLELVHVGKSQVSFSCTVDAVLPDLAETSGFWELPPVAIADDTGPASEPVCDASRMLVTVRALRTGVPHARIVELLCGPQVEAPRMILACDSQPHPAARRCAAPAQRFDLTTCVDGWLATELGLTERLQSLQPHSDDRFRSPGPALSFTSAARNGTQLCMEGLLQFLPDHDVIAFLEGIDDVCAAAARRVPGVGITVHLQSALPPMYQELQTDFAQQACAALASVGLLPVISGASIPSEAPIYARHGYEALVFGPGWPADVEPGINEAIHLDHLEVAVAFYREMIKRNCVR